MIVQSGTPSPDQVMAQAGKTFHRAARLLPRRVRFQVTQLYVFCRRVDDLADDPTYASEERKAKLLTLAAALEHGDDLAMRSADWPFDADIVLTRAAAMLVRAALGDLDQHQPESEEELLAYAFGVAGTVGIMMAEVLEASSEGFGAATGLGMAMQLSNIARDVAEDLQQGRIYLPHSWAPAPILRGALAENSAKDKELVCVAIMRLLARAEDLYNLALDGIWSLPWRIRWSILAAAMCYREIGRQVQRDIPLSWRRRTVVSTGRKLRLIAVAGLRLLLPRFWLRPRVSSWPRALGPHAFTAGTLLGVAS